MIDGPVFPFGSKIPNEIHEFLDVMRISSKFLHVLVSVPDMSNYQDSTGKPRGDAFYLTLDGFSAEVGAARRLPVVCCLRWALSWEGGVHRLPSPPLKRGMPI